MIDPDPDVHFQIQFWDVELYPNPDLSLDTVLNPKPYLTPTYQRSTLNPNPDPHFVIPIFWIPNFSIHRSSLKNRSNPNTNPEPTPTLDSKLMSILIAQGWTPNTTPELIKSSFERSVLPLNIVPESMSRNQAIDKSPPLLGFCWRSWRKTKFFFFVSSFVPLSNHLQSTGVL